MKHIVIINPMAGGFLIEQFIKEMEEEFIKRNLDYEFFHTKYPMHAAKIVSSFHEPCRFYACGGDGTLREVIMNMVHTQHELVVIPCGTGNDFAKILKDGTSYKDCFLHSFEECAQAIDVMKVNDTYCINASCFGLDADIAEHVHDLAHIKWIPKSLRYNIAVLRRIFLYKCNQVEVHTDDKLLYSGPVMMMACNNAKYYGNGFSITPEANIQDGKMNVCIIKGFPRWKILYKCFPIFQKQPQRLPETQMFTCKQLSVHSKMGINLDGETLQGEAFRITLIEAGIHLVNPIK